MKPREEKGKSAGGADVPFFGMSALSPGTRPGTKERIHPDEKRQDVCATRPSLAGSARILREVR